MESVSAVFRPVARADIVVFAAQVLLLFIVVLTSLVNLTLNYGNTNLWTMVLTSCLGYMLPHPRLKSSKEKDSQPTPSEVAGADNGVVLREFTVKRNDVSL